MKQKVKRLLTILLMITVLVISPNDIVKAEELDTPVDEEITVQYTNLSSITAGLTVSSGGLALCEGSVTMKQNLTSRIYISLLRSSSSGAYTRIKVWAQSFTGLGRKTLNKSMSVAKGYTYKIKVEVRIYNSAGTVIETAEKYSPSVVYK